MEDYPHTLEEFEKRFSSEEGCRDYLYSLRWPNGFICLRCNNEKSWPANNTLFQCSSCDYKTSVIAGTIFQGTHKPLTIWFRVIWWLTGQKNGASALGLKRILGIGSYETAWAWLHKLRRAMVTPGRNLLIGTIEVDETYIGGEKPGKRGRGAEGKTLVVIGAETKGKKSIGRIRLQRKPDASATSLNAGVIEAIQKGSVVKTDDWSGYKQLNSLGYIHETVRKDYDIDDNLLPACHLIASLLKRWLAGTHQGAVSHEHLDYYLDEFNFRFNRRTSNSRDTLFYRLLQNAVVVEPAPYKTLIKNVRGKKPIIHNI
ncbi:MAG: IS1595 family transposase [Candidatus Hodarchaeota archaeon]